MRKTAHFLEYAVLGALMLNMLVQIARARGRNVLKMLLQLALAAWLFSTAYACTDELHQLFVPGRTGKLTDVLIDSSGVLLGVLIVMLIVRAVLRRRRPSLPA